METNHEIVGGTRSFIFLTPRPTYQPTDWKSVLGVLQQNGVKVMEECSGEPIGLEHSPLIVSCVLKDFNQVDKIATELRKSYGLNVSIYRWSSPTEFFAELSTTVKEASTTR